MLNVINRNEYKQAQCYIWGKPWESLGELFERYNSDAVFESFEDRLIVYLIAEAHYDGQTYGRSDDVINALLYEEYYNGTEADKEQITKQVKSALHNLYKARFIRKDRSGNVYLCSQINFYRTYVHSTDFVKLEITSIYDDGNFGYNEYNTLYSSDSFDVDKFTDDLTFMKATAVGPYGQYIMLAQRLGGNATPSDFPNKEVYEDLLNAGWLNCYNGKVRTIGQFSIIGNDENNNYRVVYQMD